MSANLNPFNLPPWRLNAEGRKQWDDTHSAKEDRTTPGPWHVTNKRRGVHVAYVGPKNRNVATVLSGVESHANARLIAAAPDLLEAAVAALPTLVEASMCDWSDPRSDLFVDALRAAIAKAQGDA